MPARNAIKIYVENGFYHVYNRGVNKSEIFLDAQDYAVFLSYLKQYLTLKDEKLNAQLLNDSSLSSTERNRIVKLLAICNYSQEITLLAYCLMPNHFHLLIQQKSTNSVSRFMSSLSLRYAAYFNRKYKRTGHLFQGVYKAVLLTDEGHYLHISRYIHKQALADSINNQDFPSSYPEYLGLRKTEWVHPEEILSFFSNSNPKLSYYDFLTEYNPIYDSADTERDNQIALYMNKNQE
jgi:putative transposase